MKRFFMWLSPKSNSFKEAIAPKVIEPALLKAKGMELRKQGKTVATLNGSFDLMHAGHLEIIYQASCQADVLMVALNTNSSIQRYKSPLRPIIPLEYRIEMMAALAMVDYVTWFDETDPCKVLSLIQPNVHVNGAEYTEKCIEAETVRSYGGRLHLVPLIPGLSTSKIIKKIVTTCV